MNKNIKIIQFIAEVLFQEAPSLENTLVLKKKRVYLPKT